MGKKTKLKLKQAEMEVEYLDKVLHSHRKSKSCNGITKSDLITAVGIHYPTVRNADDFVPKSRNLEKAKREYLKYLYSRYHIPPHLYSGWDNLTFREWMMTVGRGGSLYREADCIREVMTKREIHEFLTKSNPSWNVPENIVRAKARCANISDKTLNMIISSGVFHDRTFMRNRERDYLNFLFKCQNDIDSAHSIRDIFDFVNVQEVFDFSGRTWGSVSRLSQQWHLENFKKEIHTDEEPYGDRLDNWGVILKYKNDAENQGLDDYYEILWKIVHLNSQKELYEEGKKQSHCVGGYHLYCQKGQYYIFSLRMTAKTFSNGLIFANEKSVVTIQVSRSDKRIMQARGRFNREMTVRERQVINKWASQMRYNVGSNL